MVCVISSTGMKLMPTNEYRARRLLKMKKAVIFKYKPFTIKLTQREYGDTQPIEYKCDTGYQNIGVSICSKKHEYVHNEYRLLADETEHHNDCRKYRKKRRNRLRYRKPRWNNRKGKICKDGFAPSIRNKRDIHIDIFKSFYAVMPITSVIIEMGQFDTQVLKAIENGEPIPQGTDYQRGERYGIATLREAVFCRDNYTCICCKRSALKENLILHVHHLGYKNGDRTNRLSNLGTVCEKCHTPKNHKPGGALYKLEPKLKNFKGATFMTMVRWNMLDKFKKAAPDIEVKITYGAVTKGARRSLHISKTHANDAYVMGKLHPKHKTKPLYYKKCRRNNRVLSKFYDAKYVDLRDGNIKKGSELGCNRINRREQRNSYKNERVYRGRKVSKGRVSTRTSHYTYRPGDTVIYNNHKDTVVGVQDKGAYIKLVKSGVKSVKKVRPYCFAGGWKVIA